PGPVRTHQRDALATPHVEIDAEAIDAGSIRAGTIDTETPDADARQTADDQLAPAPDHQPLGRDHLVRARSRRLSDELQPPVVLPRLLDHRFVVESRLEGLGPPRQGARYALRFPLGEDQRLTFRPAVVESIGRLGPRALPVELALQ